MDDCNKVLLIARVSFLTVQIPLWTIVTPRRLKKKEVLAGSDSSMDDCNEPALEPTVTESEFRFLYGRL